MALLWHPTRIYTIYKAVETGEMRGSTVLRKIDLLEFNSSVVVNLQAVDEEVFIRPVRQRILFAEKNRST